MHRLPPKESAGRADSPVGFLACGTEALQRRERGDSHGYGKESDSPEEGPNGRNDAFDGGAYDSHRFAHVDERNVRSREFERFRFEPFGIRNGRRHEIRRRHVGKFARSHAEVEKRTDSFPVAFAQVHGLEVEFAAHDRKSYGISDSDSEISGELVVERDFSDFQLAVFPFDDGVGQCGRSDIELPGKLSGRLTVQMFRKGFSVDSGNAGADDGIRFGFREFLTYREGVRFFQIEGEDVVPRTRKALQFA